MTRVDVRNTELIWPTKYDENGKLAPIERPGPYPFQIVELINAPRIGRKGKHEQLTLYDIWKGEEGSTFEEGWSNKLIWGDNKLVMASLLEKLTGKINLIYIDPPFATGADFKFQIPLGDENEEITKEHSILEEKAYRDTWHQGLSSYLQMLYERIVLMHQLLAENGSMYVHLDWRVVHHVRIMMDEIFGTDNFQREIIWWPNNPSGFKGIAQNWIHDHESLLFYSKSNNYTFNKLWQEYSPAYVKATFVHDDGDGRLYRYRYDRKQYLDESKGVPISDVWDIPFLRQNADERVGFETQKPESLLKRVVKASSNEGDLVADFFCGSGTTLAVAEKMGRRWIGCDLSRYAIHVTRKRLLEIENSQDVEDESEIYNRKARPFEVLNLGKYERQLWQTRTFSNKDEKQILYEYLAFMLRLYGAEPLSGFANIHGKKGNALVFVGAVDSPVTIQEVLDAMKDCKSFGQRELHILGWEWEMGLNDAIQSIADREGIKLKLRIIPNEVLDKEIVHRGDVRFFELAHFKVKINGEMPRNGRTDISEKNVVLKLADFVIPHTDLISEDVKKKIEKWSDWVDYWAVDFSFDNDTFHNGWVSYRTKKNRTMSLTAGPFTYERSGKYKIFVKVIDIFGIDTSQIFEIEVP
jgi:adenine-specific DNA-methyltransferase